MIDSIGLKLVFWQTDRCALWNSHGDDIVFQIRHKKKTFPRTDSKELTAAAHDTIFVEAPIAILASVTFLTRYSTWAFTVSSGIQFTATIFYQRGWNCHHYMLRSADFQFMIFCIPVTLVWSVTLEWIHSFNIGHEQLLSISSWGHSWSKPHRSR